MLEQVAEAAVVDVELWRSLSGTTAVVVETADAAAKIPQALVAEAADQTF